MRRRPRGGGAAAFLTVVSVLVLGSKVDPVLQQHGADGGQVLLGGQMQRRLPVFGQLVDSGSSQQLRAKHNSSVRRKVHQNLTDRALRPNRGARKTARAVPGCGQ